MKKTAIFVDFENVRFTIEHASRYNPTIRAGIDYNDPSHLIKLFKGFLKPNEEIYRIFFYTAYPKNYDETLDEMKKVGADSQYQTYYTAHQPKIDNIYMKAKTLIDKIKVRENIALRTGHLKIKTHDTGRPIFTQKQVDMLIGLDISHVSYMKLVDNVLLFSADTDLMPAIKVARINGLNTSIARIKEGIRIPEPLRQHSDEIRTLSLQHDIIPTL